MMRPCLKNLCESRSRLSVLASYACARAPCSLSNQSFLQRLIRTSPFVQEGVKECVKEYDPWCAESISIVRKKGLELLHDPWYNKGTAFPFSERERLGIRGLLPPKLASMELQEQRIMNDYWHGVELIRPEEVQSGGVTTEMARRWKLLQELQDRNETLFYKVLIDNFVEMAPIVYTPTVGWVCSNYHKLYRRPRGMYFSLNDKAEMASMVWNWPQQEVNAIVVTDGSRILGLGDLGANGLGIPIGKLDLYCAAAGFSPARVLPCIIDVGTNNQALRDDPLYMGLNRPRVQGEEYYELIDEFVHAVMARWPDAVLQFEDFSIDHARVLLERYRYKHLVFNDDIQGTAAVALSGLYGALRVMGLPQHELANQRIVVVGAGSAGMGVIRMIAAGMEKQGISFEDATDNFWVLDYHGLITTGRKDLPDHVQPYAQSTPEFEGQKLLEVVKRVKPTALLGLAGAGRLFTPEVLQALAEGCSRPLVFPMSNPTSKMECTSDEAIKHTQGKAIFAAGSPQPCIEYNGIVHSVSQANNMYIFPGVALGAFLGSTGIITDNMLMTCAEVLPKLISDQDVAAGRIYPKLENIRDISSTIALEVIKTAAQEGLVKGKALERLSKSDEHLLEWIKRSMFYPKYSSLVHLPVGVNE